MMKSNGPKVLFISSEVAPFSKTGGLADVSAALPKALLDAGCDVRILTPAYGLIDKKKWGITPVAEIGTFTLNLIDRSLRASLSCCENGRLKIFFVECDVLYDRAGIYVDAHSGVDYIDNDFRYIALCKSAIEYCRLTEWYPDIFHCNDWQTSLLPFYLSQERERDILKKSRSLLTIHNIAYQGIFSPESVYRIDGAKDYFYPGGAFEYHGKTSFLKAGLAFADALNTVSPTYAREIQSGPEFGYGMESVLRSRSDGVSGILNGLDIEEWNPETDRRIHTTYSSDSLDKKALNRKALCDRVGISFDEDVLIIGMISRLAAQKGFDILMPALDDILALPCRFVLLVSGDKAFENTFREYSRSHPDKIAAKIGYDEEMAHLIEAGADAFLMPSKYEPCGLNQMMSMRYGTPPIVRATGGLADTVNDADAHKEDGTGFSFNAYRSDELLKAVKRALVAYSNRPRWSQIQKNGMKQDFSWNRSANEYIRLYEQCLRRSPRTVSLSR